MPKFLYEASDEAGFIKTGEFEAAGKADVVRHLEGRRLIPVNITELTGKRKKRDFLSSSVFERVTPLDRIMIIRNLSAAIKSGLSIVEALDIMIADTQKAVVKNILISAKSNLENGQPLWKTFESYNNVFPSVFVGLVKAGEYSGNLSGTLDELSDHMVKEYALVSKVRSAMMYPLLLLAAAVVVVVFILVFVLPRLSKVFESSGFELPLITQLLISLSKTITSNFVLDGIVVAFFLWFFFYFRTRPTGKRFVNWILFRIPVVKELVKKVALVRFARTFASLLKSGASMLDTLNLSADSMSNESYKRALSESVERVKSGIPLSDSLKTYPDLFPRFLLGLMAVGEKTGTLDKTLSTFSGFYDEEVDNTLKALVSFLEPLLIIFMGLIVGLIAVSVLLPIYRLSSGFL